MTMTAIAQPGNFLLLLLLVLGVFDGVDVDVLVIVEEEGVEGDDESVVLREVSFFFFFF